ncbi:MAG: hypothetical protein MK081_13630 [Flavobacteriales bacterium]|nr:hypothetical protein [Flavobacteriales bacterium]
MSISNRSILVFLTVTLALTACKKTDSSDIQDEVPIYQDYYVRYDKTENVTVAKATFKTNGDNGDRLVLSGESSVECNDIVGEYNSNVTNYFYRWEFENFIDCSFVYVKNTTSTYSNTLSFDQGVDISFPEETASFSLGETASYEWEEGPLQAGESITFYLTQGLNSGSVIYDAEVGLEGVPFGPSLMSSLVEGAATLHITRCKVIDGVDQDDMSAGGQRVIEVKLTKDVMLTD